MKLLPAWIISSKETAAAITKDAEIARLNWQDELEKEEWDSKKYMRKNQGLRINQESQLVK